MRLPCADNPHPFDVLIDVVSGPEHRRAIEQARAICADCPIVGRCYSENQREPWVQAITGRKAATVHRPSCGNDWGYKQHRQNGEETCAKCRAYNTERKRRSVAKRRAREAA